MKKLQNHHRAINIPETLVGLCGGALATLYTAFSISLKPGTAGTFTLCVVGVMMVVSWGGHKIRATRQHTLSGLGMGTIPADRATLIRAFREAAQLPDHVFWNALLSWILGSLATPVVYALLVDGPWSVTSRIGFVGIAFAPLVAVVGHVVVLGQSRKLMGLIAEIGLTIEDIQVALPPKRNQLRMRMVLFTAAASFTPLSLICDTSYTWASSQVSSWLSVRLLDPPDIAMNSSTGFYAMWLVAGLTMLVVIVSAIIGGRVLGDPIQGIAVVTERMAQGHVGRSRLVYCEDELWTVTTALSLMEHQLVSAIGQLKGAGAKISETTQDLIVHSTRHESGAREQISALKHTSATTEELARSARQIAQKASDVSKLAQQTYESANTGKRSATAFYAAILRVREGNQVIADSVVRLNKRVQQVGRIVEFIDGIADKADLLALNAELEGTKAGSVGKGFSLVAAEMRRLSESVMVSTREITRLISEIRDATHAAVMATEAGVKATDAGAELARAVTESLDRIVEFANQTTDAVKAITLGTHQQQAGTQQLATAMADILQSTESTSGATVEISAANSNLATLSDELQTTVSAFEVTTA